MSLFRYRVFCITDAVFRYWWLDESAPVPTTCPDDTVGHTLDQSATIIIQRRQPDTVNISQETIPTGGHYRWHTFQFDALPDQTTQFDFSFPFDVNILRAIYTPATENIGDHLTWIIGENTTVGVITAPVDVDNTVITVSSTVMDNVHIGFKVNLFDGIQSNDLGYVIQKDTLNSTLTVEQGAVDSFAPASPTFVRMSVMMLDDVEIGNPSQYIFGDNKIKTSFVPANIIGTAYYTNHDPTITKRFVGNLEILY